MASPLLMDADVGSKEEEEEECMVVIGGDEEEKELRETIISYMKSGKPCPKNIADIIHEKHEVMCKPRLSPAKPSRKRSPSPLKLEIESDPDETQPWGTCDRIEPSQKRVCKIKH